MSFTYSSLAWSLRHYGHMIKRKDFTVSAAPNIHDCLLTVLRNAGLSVTGIQFKDVGIDDTSNDEEMLIEFSSEEDLLMFKLLYAENEKLIRDSVLDYAGSIVD